MTSDLRRRPPEPGRRAGVKECPSRVRDGRTKINKRPGPAVAVGFDLTADILFVRSTTGARCIPTGIITTPVVRPTCGNIRLGIYIYTY